MQNIITLSNSISGIGETGISQRRAFCIFGSGALLATSILESQKILNGPDVVGNVSIPGFVGIGLSLFLVTAASITRYTTVIKSSRQKFYNISGVFMVSTICVFSTAWNIKILADSTFTRYKQLPGLILLLIPVGHVYFGIRSYLGNVKPFKRDAQRLKRFKAVQSLVSMMFVTLWIVWLLTVAAGISRTSINVALISLLIVLESNLYIISNVVAPGTPIQSHRESSIGDFEN
jgi:hypothetical protein